MKKAAKALVVKILAGQVLRLSKNHKFKIIAVVGSIGKTSTKLAIAQVLNESMRVRYQKGNYNDLVSVPLIFFDQEMPSLMNPFAWVKIFIHNEMVINKDYPYDVVVVELGTDAPGQIAAFKRYIQADIAVITALTPEHMENFSGMPAVAEEELELANFSKRLLVGIDLAPSDLTQAFSGTFLSYSLQKEATYQMQAITFNQNGCEFTVMKDRQLWLQSESESFSEPQLYSLLAAAAVANLLGATDAAITTGFAKIEPVSGRMQRLEGLDGSVIIDDSYNASPDAVKAALKTVYQQKATQKIVCLGNMNELGTMSAVAHTEIGKLCDPEQLVAVITLGVDANKYLADAAEKNGCKVVRTNSPYEAGEKILENMQPGSLVLVKGSQNGVFAEEAIKPLLANKADESKLVRQSEAWLKIKKAQFASI